MGSGGGGGGSSTQKTVPWSGQQSYLRDLFGEAQSIYNQGFGTEYYPGPMVAPFSPQTQSGLDSLFNLASQRAPWLDPLTDYVTGTTQQDQVDTGALQSAAGSAMAGITPGMDLALSAVKPSSLTDFRAQIGDNPGINIGQLTTDFDPGMLNTDFSPLGLTTQFNPGQINTQFSPGQLTTQFGANQIGTDFQPGQLTTDFDFSGGGLNPIAANALSQSAQGSFLGGNPFLDQVYDTAANKVTQNFTDTVVPELGYMLGSAGRTGGGIQQELLAKAGGELTDSLAGLAGDIYAPAYEAERGRQIQAASQLGSLGLQGGEQALRADIAGGQLMTGAEQAQQDALLRAQQLGSMAEQFNVGTGLNLAGLQTAAEQAQQQAGLTAQNLGLTAEQAQQDALLRSLGLGSSAEQALQQADLTAQNLGLTAEQAQQDALLQSLGLSSAAEQAQQGATLDAYSAMQQGDLGRLGLAADLYTGGLERAVQTGLGLGSLGMQGIGQMGDLYGNISSDMFRGASFAPQLQQMEYADIDQLLRGGGMLEDQAQRLMDAERARFDFYQQAPWQTLGQYGNIVQGMPGGYGTTTGNESGSRAAGILGGGMAGYGLGTVLGATNPWLYALGGGLLGGF